MKKKKNISVESKKKDACNVFNTHSNKVIFSRPLFGVQIIIRLKMTRRSLRQFFTQSWSYQHWFTAQLIVVSGCHFNKMFPSYSHNILFGPEGDPKFAESTRMSLAKLLYNTLRKRPNEDIAIIVSSKCNLLGMHIVFGIFNTF